MNDFDVGPPLIETGPSGVRAVESSPARVFCEKAVGAGGNGGTPIVYPHFVTAELAVHRGSADYFAFPLSPPVQK